MATITITRLNTLLSQKSGNEQTTDLATKDFVRSEINAAKTDMVKWFVGIGLTTFVALACMIIGLYFRK